MAIAVEQSDALLYPKLNLAIFNLMAISLFIWLKLQASWVIFTNYSFMRQKINENCESKWF